MLLDVSTHSDHNFKILLSKTKFVCHVIEMIDQIFVMTSIFVFNANNPRK